MSIRILLMMTIVGTIMIAVGLLGLYVNVTKRLRDIERSVGDVRKKHSRTRQRVKDLEDQAKKEADQITFYHKWDEAADIRYPSQEV